MASQFTPPRTNYANPRGDRRWERKAYYRVVVSTMDVSTASRTLFDARMYVNRLRMVLKRKGQAFEAWQVVLWRYEHPASLRPSRRYVTCEGKEGLYFVRDRGFTHREYADLPEVENEPPRIRRRRARRKSRRRQRSRSKKRHPISGKRLLKPPAAS